MDLADGHVAALEKLFTADDKGDFTILHAKTRTKKLDVTDVLVGCIAYNLGTGCRTSVLEMVAAFDKASGKSLLKLCPRRPGDATAVYASTAKAEKELGWNYHGKWSMGRQPFQFLKNKEMDSCGRGGKIWDRGDVQDQWKWASQNPWGYQSKQHQ